MSEIRQVVRKASDNPVLEALARVGFIASAVVHFLLGYLAIHVALHLGGEADQSGALAAVAGLPFGRFILWVITIGLFALGLWLLIQASLGIGSSSKKRWLRSLNSLVKAIAYIAIGMTALTFATGHFTSSNASTTHMSASVLAMPGGRILLGIVGLVAIGVGGYFIQKGATRHFKRDIRIPSNVAERPVIVLGVVGYVAKGIVIVVVGILFIVAAVEVNPTRASGLDGALKSLVALPFGQVILVIVGVGLIAYAIYTVARARLAHL
ncbi:DUF1206 domain-containing protein [Curtobacterium ammoniigenes]|uniref:DUF1206 domain-containing protein n=1 Tax=Curtobacterium ammoniigenes TaxID=395387 RepID=UPI00082D6908|nr:DUF1206 domain-containing protein [Curtobacterium ammoniigenes]